MSIIFPTIYQNRKQYLYDILKEEHNVPSAKAIYSVRKVVSSYLGPCARILRNSDGAEKDFGFASDEIIDRWNILEWLDGSAGYITRWYDQVGGNDLTPTTSDHRPRYNNAGQNRLPQFDADRTQSSNLATMTASTSQTDNVDVVIVARAPYKDDGNEKLLRDNNNNFLYSSASRSLRTYDGNKVLTFSSSEWGQDQVVWRVYHTQSELHLRHDRRSQTISTSNTNVHNETGFGEPTSTGSYLRFQEMFVFSDILSDAAFERIDTEMRRLHNSRNLNYLGMDALNRCEFFHNGDLFAPDDTEQENNGSYVWRHDDATFKNRDTYIDDANVSPVLTRFSNIPVEQYDGGDYHILDIGIDEWGGIVSQEWFVCFWVQKTATGFRFIFGNAENQAGSTDDGVIFMFLNSGELSFSWSYQGNARQITSVNTYSSFHSPFIASAAKRNNGNFEIWHNNTQLTIGTFIDENPQYDVDPLKGTTPYIGSLNAQSQGVRTGFNGSIGPRALSTNLSDFDVVRQYMVSRFI